MSTVHFNSSGNSDFAQTVLFEPEWNWDWEPAPAGSRCQVNNQMTGQQQRPLMSLKRKMSSSTNCSGDYYDYYGGDKEASLAWFRGVDDDSVLGKFLMEHDNGDNGSDFIVDLASFLPSPLTLAASVQNTACALSEVVGAVTDHHHHQRQQKQKKSGQQPQLQLEEVEELEKMEVENAVMADLEEEDEETQKQMMHNHHHVANPLSPPFTETSSSVCSSDVFMWSLPAVSPTVSSSFSDQLSWLETFDVISDSWIEDDVNASSSVQDQQQQQPHRQQPSDDTSGNCGNCLSSIVGRRMCSTDNNFASNSNNTSIDFLQLSYAAQDNQQQQQQPSGGSIPDGSNNGLQSSYFNNHQAIPELIMTPASRVPSGSTTPARESAIAQSIWSSPSSMTATNGDRDFLRVVPEIKKEPTAPALSLVDVHQGVSPQDVSPRLSLMHEGLVDEMPHPEPRRSTHRPPLQQQQQQQQQQQTATATSNGSALGVTPLILAPTLLRLVDIAAPVQESAAALAEPPAKKRRLSLTSSHKVSVGGSNHATVPDLADADSSSSTTSSDYEENDDDDQDHKGTRMDRDDAPYSPGRRLTPSRASAAKRGRRAVPTLESFSAPNTRSSRGRPPITSVAPAPASDDKDSDTDSDEHAVPELAGNGEISKLNPTAVAARSKQVVAMFKQGRRRNGTSEPESLEQFEDRIVRRLKAIIIEHIQAVGAKIRREAETKSRQGDYLSRMKGCLRNAAMGLWVVESVVSGNGHVDLDLIHTVLDCVPPPSTRPSSRLMDAKLLQIQHRLGLPDVDRNTVDHFWTAHILHPDRVFMRRHAKEWPGHWEKLGL